jgi:hypothetical protein
MDKTTSAIMGALFLSGVAVAQDGRELTFADEDDNGYVSRQEARVVPEILELFGRVDQNRDGQLDTVEYAQAAKQLQG